MNYVDIFGMDMRVIMSAAADDTDGKGFLPVCCTPTWLLGRDNKLMS